MPKAKDISNLDGTITNPYIMCPGCERIHVFDERWSFNGDYEKPTFTPSMLVNANMPLDVERGIHRCHSFVTDGKIQFLSDCTHKYAGQTLELPDVE